MAQILNIQNCMLHRTLQFVNNPNQHIDFSKPMPMNDDEWDCHHRIIGEDYDFNSAIIFIEIRSITNRQNFLRLAPLPYFYNR